MQIGDLAVVVGCMDAWPASGACGAQPQAMCALQQGWVLRAKERQRTATSTGRSSCRSMRHERDVDLALEGLQIVVDEPPKKTPRAGI